MKNIKQFNEAKQVKQQLIEQLVDNSQVNSVYVATTPSNNLGVVVAVLPNTKINLPSDINGVEIMIVELH
jgi:hypothetical protein